MPKYFHSRFCEKTFFKATSALLFSCVCDIIMGMRVTILNGPNLNLLGQREIEIYGRESLESLNGRLLDFAKEKGLSLTFHQTSFEGEIINIIHTCSDDFLVLNAGALSHYSYAIRDAIASVGIPVIEVHISDVSAREPFRQVNVLKDVCKDFVYGRGVNGYFIALERIIKLMNNE